MTIHYIDMTLITVGNRHRKKFAKQSLADLKKSILLPMGLLHPITVRAIPPIYKGSILDSSISRYELVVGERRLRAMIEIHLEEQPFFFGGLEVSLGMIPCLIADPNLTDMNIREAELDENIRREDLTWQERIDAIAELHALRVLQNPLHTFTDTSREIPTISRAAVDPDNLPRAAVSPDNLPHPESTNRQNAMRIANAVLIAEHMNDEEVANAQTERDALRIITQKLERQFALATVKPLSTIHTLYCEDFRLVEFITNTPFDTVITDPPYGMGVKDFGDAARLRHEYTEDDYLALHMDLVAMLNINCADDAHVYLFCDLDNFHTIAEMFRLSNWKVRRAPLIWSKGNSGHLSEGDVYGFRRSYEFILHARRGNKSHKTLINDIIQVTPARNKYHAAEKPVELYTILMNASTYPGEFVFDPFAGSGPIFAAANTLGAIATGCEISEKYVEYIEATYNLRRT